MNQKAMAGVTYMDMNQDPSSKMITTMGSEKTYSPVCPSTSSMGRKARMVVRDEVKRGTARVRPASLQAAARSSPRSRRLRISSTTTMALSTSMPRATIDEMIETRSSSMPN